MNTPEIILKKYWGFSSFRPLQGDIIKSILLNQDTLALLPTGGGKSICYQVPSLLKEGICIVITPLIALMNDQIRTLRKKGISAVAIHSGLDYREIDNALNSCIYGNIKFLYCSPERLQTDLFKKRVKEMNVNLLAVDEAHCISQWGHDFRPSYLQLKVFRNTFKQISVLALTATANAKVQTEIQKELGFKESHIFKGSFSRPNISFSVRVVENKETKLVEILLKIPGSAIVYARSRRLTKTLSELLISNKISSSFFHAGLNSKEKEIRQENWLNNNVRVIVATNAFGMGIDKSNVRLVVHYEPPNSIEDYYQEAGRVGRDGKLAFAVLLSYNSDTERMKQQLEQNHPSPKILKQLYQSVANHFQMAIGSGYMSAKVFEFNEFCAKYKFDKVLAYHAFKRLEEEELFQLTDPYFQHSRLKITINNIELYKFQVENANFDTFIKGILRLYGGGIFTDFLAISEKKIAKFIELKIDTTIELLKKLNKMGIISYVRSSGKSELLFLQPRIDVSKLFRSEERLVRLKKNANQRLNAILSYLNETNICRMQQLLIYFDDICPSCGKCDICLEKKDQKKDENYEIIVKKIELGENTLEQLLTNISSLKKEQYLEKIRKMLDSGVIIEDTEGILRLA